MGKIEILISPAATTLEKFAAGELARYLAELFGVCAKIMPEPSKQVKYRFILGLSSEPLVKKCAKILPALSGQGHLVRRIARDTMLLAGGSPAAVAWAVYELVERYGVRYLLHEDIFSGQTGPFYLPDVDVCFEPVQKLRSSLISIDLPTGSALWSAEQSRTFLKQIFKLKFNGVKIFSYPQSPLVDFEVAGIRRKSGHLLFGQKIPIDRENIGFEQLPPLPYLTNPEFAGIENFPELLEAGKKLTHTLIDEARQLGMYTAIFMNPMEFPLEFRPLLEKPSGSVQLGGLTTAEMGDLTNPNHVKLMRAQIEAYLATYGKIDDLVLNFPEHPHADRVFPQCWRELSAKHRLEPDFNIGEMLAASRKNNINAGGPQREEREFKSVISMLHFFDRFFAGNNLLEKANNQNIKVGVSVGANAVEAYSLLGRVLWPGATFSTRIDYTSSRAIRNMHYMEKIDANKLPVFFSLTLQDDNIGSLPQVATENIHILMQEMHRLGWQGYWAVFWPIGDLDPTFTYMARASWDTSITPHAAYLDHFEHVYGKASTGPLCRVMRILEDATILLDMGLEPFFPVLGVMDYRIKSDKPMSATLFHVCAMYEQVLRILERLQQLPGSPGRKSNLDYWISRMEFSIHALRELEFLCAGGTAVHLAIAAQKSGDAAVVSEEMEHAGECYDRAIREGEAALRAVASHLRDESDRNTLVAYYHFLVREVKHTTKEFLQSALCEQVEKT